MSLCGLRFGTIPTFVGITQRPRFGTILLLTSQNYSATYHSRWLSVPTTKELECIEAPALRYYFIRSPRRMSGSISDLLLISSIHQFISSSVHQFISSSKIIKISPRRESGQAVTPSSFCRNDTKTISSVPYFLISSAP